MTVASLCRRLASACFAAPLRAGALAFAVWCGVSGPVEAAPALFEGRGSCLAFRFAHPDLAFRLSGWLCGPEGRPVDEEGLVCAIDRLVLAPGVQDPALRVLFAQAERRRTGGCAPLHFAGAP